MKHLGHIRIKDNKVIFVYRELPVPRKDAYQIQQVGVVAGNIVETESFRERDFLEAMKEYNASKREVEVSNAEEPFCGYESCTYLKIGKVKYVIKDNQPCEAEINGKAKIIKIL